MTTDFFSQRYKKLNARQKQAVDTIHGPLLVIAGPGTGKTELLSMRAASILQKTDAAPQSILCLTFTDSGAVNMRKRLGDIIGPDAYKTTIHTFHSFGAEIINQHQEHFYRGIEMKPADELATYQILREIFDKLDYTNPLSTKNNGEYVHIKQAARTISDLKQSGLTSDELRTILQANEHVCDVVEKEITALFSSRITKSSIEPLGVIAHMAANVQQPTLPAGITPYANVLALSLAHAVEKATELDKTTPITEWKRTWLKSNEKKQWVLKDRSRHAKLMAIADVYYQYLDRMEQEQLFDFDDMILQVIHAIETRPELQASLQEQYQYIMVDEFQDTNLAQLRILFSLTQGVDQPNIMAVGDDDQAIFSFQGADVNNIHRFRQEYSDPETIVLIDNYRSAAPILTSARDVITQGGDRLETSIAGLSKQLTPHASSDNARVSITQHDTYMQELAWVASDIRAKIDSGVAADSIAILSKKHSELIDILPHLIDQQVHVNYEKRENILDHPVITAIESLVRLVYALQKNQLDTANALLPEIVSHPAYAYQPQDIWQLSLTSYRNKTLWLETMSTQEAFVPLQKWIITTTALSTHTPFEQLLDHIIGTHSLTEEYTSPFASFFFNEKTLDSDAQQYLAALESLRTLRDTVREYTGHMTPSIEHFIDCIDIHRQLEVPIMATRAKLDQTESAIHLMTAHKSKGLEFEHVYVIDSIDSVWGEKVRTPPQLISYPENLPLQKAGGSYNERLRLYYVAMTRAKRNLTISYSVQSHAQKDTLPAAFLTNSTVAHAAIETKTTLASAIQQAETEWHQEISKPTSTLKELLQPTLSSYKLSATHLNAFLDVSRGGPQNFLLKNLLRMPQAKHASACYGTAIHSALQHAHNYVIIHNKQRPLEDILGHFNERLQSEHLAQADYDLFVQKGITTLSTYLAQKQHTFTNTQKTELSFSNQHVFLDEAHLSGALDLVDIDEEAKRIVVTDYKTGAPSSSWKGSQDYQKIKLHHYRQQLLFYNLLIKNSRDYSKYTFAGGVLQFVEPSKEGHIYALDATFTEEEIEEFETLVKAVWRCIIELDLPDSSQYDPSYKGIIAFEKDILAKYHTM